MKLFGIAKWYQCVLIFMACTGIALADDEMPADASAVLNALEVIATKVAEEPGNCDVVQNEAKLFQEKYGNALEALSIEDTVSVDESLQARLDDVFEKLSPSLMICSTCPNGSEAADKSAVSKDDPCKDTKKKCERNCPLGGWSCASHWAGCLSGYRPSCCWAAACGSKKNCMRVCQSSCVCSVD